jgi:hypothetical protein
LKTGLPLGAEREAERLGVDIDDFDLDEDWANFGSVRASPTIFMSVLLTFKDVNSGFMIWVG